MISFVYPWNYQRVYLLQAYNTNKETMQSSVNVTIEVEDVNDNTPSFNDSVYHILVNETGNEDEQVLLHKMSF
jgi:hypothetical protein